MVILYVTHPFNPLSMPHAATTNKGAAVCKGYMVCDIPAILHPCNVQPQPIRVQLCVMVIWYVTCSFNPLSMTHAATTNKGAAVCKDYMVHNKPLQPFIHATCSHNQ